MPVIIYPFRLDADYNSSFHSVEAKNIEVKGTIGKYTVNGDLGYYNKKIKFKIKNGAKDSFKTGTHLVEYDKSKKLLTVSGADFWSGFNGLSHTDFMDKT